MDSEPIEKKSRLGEGAYGIVYQGEIKRNNKIVKVAVKRNFGEPDITEFHLSEK